jgi:23S rRNA (adenine2030-N6)-methyltransferase
MNYRHAFHAGNFADVQKHIALLGIIQNLAKKAKPFAVIDTHAGRGLYDLAGDEARRTGEAAAGIERLLDYEPRSPLLRDYLSLVRSVGRESYPGSSLIMAKLLRPQDRLIAIEKHPEEFAVLKKTMAPFPQATVIAGDGHALLPGKLPPPERRGLVLVDPPYEDADEFARLGRSVVDAFRRFGTGTFLIWYPLKLESAAEALAGELLAGGATDLMRLTLDVGRKAGDGDRLSAAGLLAINPPYRFDSQMREASEEILPLLARGADAHAAVEWLAGPT